MLMIQPKEKLLVWTFSLDYIITLFHPLTNRQNNSFFGLEGFTCSSPSSHLLTWSGFDARLQPKDPVVEVPSASVASACMFSACGERLPITIWGILLVFTAVLFRTLASLHSSRTPHHMLAARLVRTPLVSMDTHRFCSASPPWFVCLCSSYGKVPYLANNCTVVVWPEQTREVMLCSIRPPLLHQPCTQPVGQGHMASIAGTEICFAQTFTAHSGAILPTNILSFGGPTFPIKLFILCLVSSCCLLLCLNMIEPIKV